MPLTDDLQLVAVRNAGKTVPQCRIRCKQDRVEMTITNAAMREAGFTYGDYVQLYLSTTTLQLRKCGRNAPGARRISRSNLVLVKELRELWAMPDGESVEITVEVNDDPRHSRTPCLLGTIPAAYRETLRQRRVIREVA